MRQINENDQLDIQQLGRRICVIGPSCSGKSTFSEALALKLGISVTHLDFLAHYTDTNWKRKSDDEFVNDHNKILNNDSWIIEGNYSVCMKNRFEKATSIIWLDMNTLTCAFRYLKRCLISNKQRAGKLPGSKQEFSLWLIKHILFTYPKNRIKYCNILKETSLPIVIIRSMKKLEQTKKHWAI